ncbi:MAG: AAA family ATPase [Candidatus Igneacidithiobacillus chanchocoensis]
MNTEILAILTVGTSASGKSTWAQSLAERFPQLRINILERDQLRQELYAEANDTPFSWADWDSQLEEEVQSRWLQRLRELLDADVLVLADTHIDPAQLTREARILADLGVRELLLQYFPPRPLVELIRYDQNRSAPVGAAVLRQQIQRLQPEEVYWQALESVSNEK